MAQHRAPTATYLLGLALVRALILVVDSAKVGHDNWHWKRDDQHTAERTNTAHYFAYHCCWHHVAVAAKSDPKVVRMSANEAR